VGDEQLCPRAEEAGWARDGGYAEYVLVPSRRYLLPLQGLDPVRAAPLADAGLTPFRAVRRIASRLSDGDRAVVIGIGGLGQFGLQYLRRLTPASVVAVDRDLGKLSMAKALGCTEALPPDGLDGEAAAVLDFVGSNESLALAARVVRRGGTVLQIGEAGGRLSVGLGRFPHEATYTSSIWGSLAELREVLDLARRGEVRCTVEALPLSEAAQAFDRLRSGDVRGRLVLVPSQGRATGAAPPI
jgi:propanol-preferring alcohol dehydrogenase